MADPSKFTPGFDYSGWEASNPTTPKPGAQLDNDFANIETSIDEAVDAIKDVRRSDGALKNGIVTIDSLSASVKTLTGINMSNPTWDLFAELTPAADKLPYFVSSAVAGLADFTAFARTLLAFDTAASLIADLSLLQSDGGNSPTADIDWDGNSITNLGSVTFSSISSGTAATLTLTGTSKGIDINHTGSGNVIDIALDMTNSSGAGIYMYGSNPPVGAGIYDYLLFQHRNDADTADITSLRAESDGAWNFGWYPFIEIGGSGVFPKINLHGDGNGAQALSTLAIGDPANSQLCGRISMYKSRGGDPSTRGLVSNGDPLGYTQYVADNGVNLQNVAARFGAEIQGTPSSTALPTAFRISLTPAGTIGLQTAFYLTNAGQLQLPGTAAVDGTAYERLFLSNAGGQSAGTAALIRTQPTNSTNRGVSFGGINEGSNDLSFTVRHGSAGGSEPTIDKFKVRLSGAIEILDGITAPSSTSSGMAAIYSEDTGGGGRTLRIRFADGTVQTIVTK